MIECSIEAFVPVVAVAEHKAVPSIGSSSAKGDFEREKEVEDSMLGLLELVTEGSREDDESPSTSKAGRDFMHLIAEQSLEDKPPLVVTDAAGEILAKETKSKNGIIGSQTGENHNVVPSLSEGSQL